MQENKPCNIFFDVIPSFKFFRIIRVIHFNSNAFVFPNKNLNISSFGRSALFFNDISFKNKLICSKVKSEFLRGKRFCKIQQAFSAKSRPAIFFEIGTLKKI